MSGVIPEIIKGVIDGIEHIADAVKRGQSWEDLTLAEIIPDEVRSKINAASERADDYILNG